jgi:hypothetical protein
MGTAQSPHILVSDRKYRQRGYMDDGGDRSRKPQGAPAPREHPRDRVGPRTFNMPGYREVIRCARCGNPLASDIAADTKCPRCGTDLHACVQCAHFDTGRRFECDQPLTARVSPKDARNECTLFEAQRRVERETTTPVTTSSARQAFDDLFK